MFYDNTISYEVKKRLSDHVPLSIIFTVTYGKWYDHVLGYWKRRHDENILFLFYEDMKKVGRPAYESETLANIYKNLKT